MGHSSRFSTVVAVPNQIMAKVLVIEDDKAISKLVCDYLQFEHHVVEAVYDGNAALERFLAFEYDLVIMDLTLPGIDGIELCRELRGASRTAPVLMLTGRQKITDKEEGFDAGADDYLTKPFNLRELGARVKALLRRSSSSVTSNVLSAGDIVLDPVKYKITRAGKEVKLVPKEFALLEFMMRNKGIVFSAEALLARVWTATEESSPEIIRTYIKTLRKKLQDEDGQSIIQTVHGVGYRLEEPDKS